MTPPRPLPPAVALAAVLLLAPATAPVRGAASGWAENPESRVRLVTPYRVAPRDAEIWLGLHFRLTEGWHVYWKDSGDAGFPPEVRVEDTPELTGAELLWPAPERYELPGDLVAFGYEDEVVYPVRATLEAGDEESVEIALAVDYLVCEVDCIPYGYVLRVDQPVGPEAVADPETAPLLESWRARLPVPATELPGVETDGTLDLSDFERPVLEVTVTGVRPAPGARPELFLEAHELFDPDRPELEESPAGLRFRIPMEVNRRLEEAPASVDFAWTVTGLAATGSTEAGGSPLAVTAQRTVPAGTGGASAGAGEGERGPAEAPGGASARLLVQAFAGGIVLALTPGSLALLLALLGSLRRRSEPRAGKTTHPALPAVAGCLAAGLALGAADAATAGSGWSRLLQEPLAVAALALVTLLFALGLWGFLRRRSGADDGASGRAPRAAPAGATAFAAGALLPVLALPWALPPAAPALDRASALGPGVAVAAALAVAAGLAVPLLAALPLFRRSGPAPPAAPTRRTEALGFLAAVSLVWLLYVLSGLLASEDQAFVEVSLLGVGLAAWGLGRARRPAARRAWGVLALLAAVAALWLAAVG